MSASARARGLPAGRGPNRSGLEVLARARWPERGDGPPPALPGFVLSNFSPLAAAVADRCLQRRYGGRGADPVVTAVVLASRRGDVATCSAVRRAIVEGRAMSPLLFFQSVPNAVAGHVAARWRLHGPVVCTSPLGEHTEDALEVARLLIEDREAGEVLVVVVEAGAVDRSWAEAVVVRQSHGGTPAEGGRCA